MPGTGETIDHKSYSIPDDMLEEGQIRLLDTDISIVVPVDIHVSLLLRMIVHSIYCSFITY